MHRTGGRMRSQYFVLMPQNRWSVSPGLIGRFRGRRKVCVFSPRCIRGLNCFLNERLGMIHGFGLVNYPPQAGR